MIDAAKIQLAVQERFAMLARLPECEKRFEVGANSAKRLGYSANEIDALPAVVTESFAGVGNPFSLGAVAAGENVLDLGCGSGLDTILSARNVGPNGKVFAIDMTQEMIDKAARNARMLNLSNIEFHRGDIDALPYPDQSIDVAISNGVFNLCTDKPKVLREIYRVLKRNGRLQMADILLESETFRREGDWSD